MPTDDPRDDVVGPALFDIGRALGILDRNVDDIDVAEARNALAILDGLHDLYCDVAARAERKVYPRVEIHSATVRPLFGGGDSRPVLSLVT